jgi:hypothetical protein
LLKDEMDKRFKAHQKSIERDAPGRSRLRARILAYHID